MAYVLTDEQREFRDVLRRFVAEATPLDAVRETSASDTGFDAGLWKQLTEELGLAGIAIAEERGGQGYGIGELAIAAGELGRGLVPSPFFGSAVLSGRVLAHAATSAAIAPLVMVRPVTVRLPSGTSGEASRCCRRRRACRARSPA